MSDRATSKIYLTGFMASGKSTVGPLVARRAGARFTDLDDAVEAQAGRSIPEIFEAEGEAGFRRREAEALRRVGRASGAVVVATGGGTLVREGNLRRALGSGTVVYLRASAAVLSERLATAAAERPLLQDDRGRPLTGDALADHIGALLSERRRFYERAHVTVDTGEATPEASADAILRATGLPSDAPS